MNRLKLTLSALIFCLAWPFSALAATFEVRDDLAPRLSQLTPLYSAYVDLPANRADLRRPTRPVRSDAPWVIKMSGVIEKGDTDKLWALVERMHDQKKGWGWRLVLESPGGNFLEGIALGRSLGARLGSQDPDFVGVYVLANTECLSACALAFSLASERRTLDDFDSYRFIEVGGRIGFHMGALPDGQAFQQAQVKAVMDLTYDIMAAYMTIVTGELNKPELIAEALKHRSADSFFYVGASDRAYDLGFIPVSTDPLSEPLHSAALSMAQVYHLCTKLRDISQIPLTTVTEMVGDLFPIPNGTVSDFFKSHRGTAFRGSFRSGEHCLMARTSEGNLFLDVTRDPPECIDSENGYDAWCAIDTRVQRLATNALLADISACHMGQLHPMIDPASNVLSDDAPWRQRFGQAAIMTSVNMRATPSLKAARLGEVPEGTRFRVRGCQVTTDNQAVWLKLDHAGRTGWISARFANIFAGAGINSDDRFD